MLIILDVFDDVWPKEDTPCECEIIFQFTNILHSRIFLYKSFYIYILSIINKNKIWHLRLIYVNQVIIKILKIKLKFIY